MSEPRKSLAVDCPYCPSKAGETCRRFGYNHPGHPMEKSPEYRLANGLPVMGEYVDFEKLALEERFARIELTLGTLISWLSRELGTGAVNELLGKLKEPQ